jgi:acyl carrier protein
LLGASPTRQRALLADLVGTETARVLGLAGREAIDPGQGFFALGMDSLTSLELRNRLAAALRCTLPATVAFDHPNVEALAAFVHRALAPVQEQEHESSQDLTPLSTAELDRLIDELAHPAR